MQVPFTAKTLAGLTIPEGATRLIVCDTRQRGLYYYLGAGGGAFYFNYSRDGKNRRERLDSLTLPEARAEAEQRRGTLAARKLRHRRTGPTFAEACERYLTSLRTGRCSIASIATFKREMITSVQFADWQDRHLRSLTARECIDRYDALAVKVERRGGPSAANRFVRNFVAMWNFIARQALIDDESWPSTCPASVVDLIPVAPRREPIPWGQLPTWRAAVNALSPVRRDYNLLLLLTGLRRMDAATVEWKFVNLSDAPLEAAVWDVYRLCYTVVEIPPRAMLRPSPKGGQEKGFILPLSKAAVELLTRMRNERGADDGWVFPSRSIKSRACAECTALGRPPHTAGAVCHLVEPKEDHAVLRSPHHLRYTYATAARRAGVHDSALKRLLNHGPGHDVTDGYVYWDFDFLREAQEEVSSYLIARM